LLFFPQHGPAADELSLHQALDRDVAVIGIADELVGNCADKGKSARLLTQFGNARRMILSG